MTLAAVTFFTDYAAQFKREEALHPAELARRISDMVAAEKARLPWLKLARFGSVRSERNSLRHDANVLAISGIEGDYDGEKIDFDEAVEIADKAGLAAILYTSPSHTAEKPRWRVLCPLSQELPPADRYRLVARLNGLYGGIFAAESFTLSQSYYYGRVIGAAEHRVQIIDGTPIDFLDSLDEIAIGRPNGSAGQAGDNLFSGFGARRSFDQAAIAAEIVTGTRYHTACTQLLGRWAYEGVAYLDALHRLQAIFEKAPMNQRDARWRERYADIPRCLRDIYGKEAAKEDAAAEEAAAGAGAAGAAHDDEDFEEQRKASEPNGKANPDPRALPTIKLSGGSLPHSVDDAEQILIEHDPEVFQRGDFVVRPAKETITISDQRQACGLRLVPIKPQHLVERLTRIINFQRFDLRSKKWGSINCPPDVAAAYLERVGSWKLPILTGIVNAPTLRPDGSILDQAGYDTVTGILYSPAETYPPIPPQPTKEQASAALAELVKLIAEFPLVGKDGEDATGVKSPSRSVALSAILTAVIRRSIPHAPLHAFTAPVMGSGKSKLVDIASMVATGHEAPVISQGKTEEEMEKRLGAALIAGDTLISFDNCEQAIGGELLCQALTQPVLKIRILGKSVIVAVPSNAMFAATGNNLVIAGDMVRRTIVGTLDPRVERPETRTFKGDDPIAVIRRERPRYVAAALAVLRAYIVAGSPEQGAKPLGSFEGWSRMVRDALLWLGEDDPCATIERARAEDPYTQALGEVLLQWREAAGEIKVTVKRAIEIAGEKQAPEKRDPNDFLGSEPVFKHPEFRDALLEVAGDRGVISNMRLGKWLAKNKGRVVGGLRIDPGLGAGAGGVLRWKLSRAPKG